MGWKEKQEKRSEQHLDMNVIKLDKNCLEFNRVSKIKALKLKPKSHTRS